MAKGVDWKKVQYNALGSEQQKLYKAYADAFEKAGEAGRKLKEAITAEWNKKYPNGKDGKVFTFNAIGGTLLYAEVDKSKAPKAKELDKETGDNIFA